MTRYPNLFLVGAPKCGTTSIAYCLSQHPEIFTPSEKEPFYFGQDFIRKHSPSRHNYCSLFADWNNEQYALDASTQYFYSVTAPTEIKTASPCAKIIIMIRDPIEAAYSLYQQNRYAGLEPLKTFEESLAAEEVRAREANPPKYGHLEQLLYSRVYAFSEHIARYQSVFGKEKVYVILLEEFKLHTEYVLRRLWGFLDLPFYEVVPEVKNAGGKRAISKLVSRITIAPPPVAGRLLFFIPKVKRVKIRKWLESLNTMSGKVPELNRETKQLLTKKFAPEVMRLSNDLDKDLSHWLQSDAKNC